MGIILLNSFSFLATILLAYGLKHVGIFRQEDGQVLSKMIVYITLPATIVNGVNGTKISTLFLVLAGIGLASNFILIAFAYCYGLKEKDRSFKGLLLFTTGGYNIGNFAIPFVMAFFPSSIPYLGMFDMGNSFMVAGGTAALTDRLTAHKEDAPGIKDIVKKLAKSPTFVVYILIFTLSILGLSIPDDWMAPFKLLASANSFLSMFMIGLFMKINLHKEGIRNVRKLLLGRYAMATVLAVLIYLFLPLSHLIKSVLVLIMFAPISNLTVIQASEFGADEGVSGLASSLSIILSLVIMSAVVLILL
jgi:predicted permease